MTRTNLSCDLAPGFFERLEEDMFFPTVRLVSVSVTLCVAGGACSKLKGDEGRPEAARRASLEPAPQSIKSVMHDAIPIHEPAVIVSEEAFNALLQASGVQGLSETLRGHATLAAGQAADPLALGVFGTRHPSSPAYVDTNLFIVARDAAASPDDDIETRDFFVAAVALKGDVAWAATAPKVAVLDGFPGSRCSSAFRGCKGLFGSRPEDLRSHRYASADENLAGLPRAVTANFESGQGPVNASSRRPTVKIFTETSGSNEFACHLPVEWAQCEASFLTQPPLLAGDRLDLPSGTIMIDERDFLQALHNNTTEPASNDTKHAAVELVTVANAANRLDLRAALGNAGSFEGELFAVVRNPVLEGDVIGASQFYFAAVRLNGEAAWIGREPSMLFQPPLPSLDVGPCGPVSVTEDGPWCDTGECFPPLPPVPLQENQPLFGNNRWPSASRTTLRLPNSLIPTKDITTFACARFQPVPPTNPCGGPGELGQSFTESCNGLDDNCNGQIDENGVCANRNVCTTCQARGCAAQGITCGSVHDGCGAVLKCGGGSCP